MAGSASDFVYFDNFGGKWLMRIDKSNALGAGFQPITTADLGLYYLPRNVKPRYVTAKHPTRPIVREIYCPSQTSPIWTGSQTTINLVDYQDRSIQAFSIKNRFQERSMYYPHVEDTYQTDNP